MVFNALLEDECAVFDRAAYKIRLADTLPQVTVDQIHLTVVCASVIVTSTIVAPNHSTAETYIAALAPLVADKAVAAQKLGVSLAAISPATLGPPLIIPAPVSPSIPPGPFVADAAADFSTGALALHPGTFTLGSFEPATDPAG